MKTNYLLKLFLLIFCFLPLSIWSQEAKIEITKIETVNNKLVITYDFAKELNNELYDVWIEITTLSGRRINARTLSGDIGDYLAAGLNKQIIWDYVADDIVMDEEINIEVKALVSRSKEVIEKRISKGQAMLLSSVMPGLGLAKIDRGKPYWLMGVGTYLLVGGSVLLNNKAYTEYSSYKTEMEVNASADYLSKSRSYNNLSKGFAYAAIGLWGVSMLWTALKPAKTDKVGISAQNPQRLNIYSNYDSRLGTVGFTLKYRF